MGPKNKIQWKREEIEFFKRNYCRTTLTREEVRKSLNEKFNIDRTKSAIIKIIRVENIKKDVGYFKKTIIRTMEKSWKERDEKVQRYKRKVAVLLRRYSEEGMTSKQAQLEAQKELEEPISLYYVQKIAKEHRVRFKHTHQLIAEQSLPEGILENKEFGEFVRDQKNHGESIYEMESNIIERFEFRLSTDQIRGYCSIKKIKLKWNVFTAEQS